MLPSELRQLVEHMEWADALVWSTVLASPQTHSDALLRERLHHVHTVQWVYLHLWRAEPLDLPDLSTFEDLASLHPWAREFYAGAAEYFGSLAEGTLVQQVHFPWAEQWKQRWGAFHPATLAQSILQITSHSTYHRGQVNTHLRQLGVEPPLVDFIAWIWRGQPAPVWTHAPAA